MYQYKAQILEIIDGDTIKVLLDLGFGVSFTTKIRFAEVNTPEFKTEPEKAEKAKEFVSNFLNGQSVYITTIKDRKEKYGRYLGYVFVEGNVKSLNQTLKDMGWAYK